MKMKEKYGFLFKMTEEKKRVLVDLLLMAVLVSVVDLAAYKVNGIYPFGDASIARGDMVQQTIPAGMYYVWDVLHGKASPFFTWNSAFGMNISGASSLGALLSPLNILLYFSTRDNLVNFVNLLLILKMICIAYAMYFYLRRYEVKSSVHIIGGILYAFGAASLVHFQIMLVMDVAFLLPLLMIGLERIFRCRGCKFFILVLALCMMVNVYTGCITLIFIFLSCGMRVFLGMEDRAEKRKCALRLGVSVGAALLLSAVVSIPALICVGDAPRLGDSDYLNTYLTALQSSWSISEWKTVERMLINIALPCACILFFMLHGKNTLQENLSKYKGHIIMVFFMFLSVLVSGIELLWHGGSRASWPLRFVYVISFLLIDFAVAVYQENKSSTDDVRDKINQWSVFGFSLVAALVSGGIFSRIYETYCQSSVYATLQDGFLCILAELLFFGIYCCIFHSKHKALILLVLCMEIAGTSVISFAPNKDNVSVWSAEYLKAANNVAMSMETEPDEFERMKNMDYAVDHIEYSLVLGEEAISNYWHVISSTLQSKFSALGYSTNWTQLLDTGGTVFTDTLFNIKYYLNRNEMSDELYDFCEDVNENDTDVLHIYQNKFELPFVINTNVSELAPGGDQFETQNSLFAAITGSDSTLIEDLSGQISDNSLNIEIGNDKKLLYFYGTNTSDNAVSIMVNGNAVNIPASSSTGNQQYPADFCNGLVCLGIFQNENVTVQFSGSTDLSGLHLGLLDFATFEKGIETVKSQNPEIVSLERGKSSVDIKLDNVTKQNVFLPITYDDGWVCKVNGEKVSKINSIDGMLSIPVVQGENHIELTYVAPGRKTGAVLSVCALLGLIVFVLLDKKGKIPDGRLIAAAAHVAYVVLLLLFLVFVILFFAIPTWFYLRGIFIASE